MKKELSMFIVLLLLISPVHATATYEATCENDSEFAKFANHCGEDKFDPNTENGNELGIGADVVVWKNGKENSLIEEAIVEYRYDTTSDNQKGYAVVRLNLWQKLISFLKK